MKLQVLVATMYQKDFSLIEKMNIQTDAIVGNQCNINKVTEFQYKEKFIKWLSFNETGVGLNRNNALMRANADVVMFADDDMVFVNDYKKIVTEAYHKIPNADIIIFDLCYPNGGRKPITKIQRLSAKQCMRFGAARISAKLSSLRINGISFNLCFGGGAEYSSGEDSLFLMECIRKGLKIYSYPAIIAKLEDRESSWFKGYNDKYFFDKGVLFSLLSPRTCYLTAALHCFKHRKIYSEYGFINGYRQMSRGIKCRKEK